MTSPEDKCAKCGHERRFHPTREGVRCWRSTKTAYKDVNGDSEYRECDCTGFLDTMTELERVEEIRIRAKDAIRQEYAMGIGPSVATAGKDLAWLCDIARKALEGRDGYKAQLVETLKAHNENGEVLARLQRRLDVATKIVHELKEDLAGELADRYSHCLDYPSMKREYDQDMEPVERARAWMEDKQDG